MKKEIIVVNDDYPTIDKKTVHATDYIINQKYSNTNYNANNFILTPKYLSQNYYVQLFSDARQHKTDNIIIENFKKQYNNKLAIMYDPKEENPPSGFDSLLKMQTISEQLGFDTTLITYNELKDNYLNYDVLFIRETTAVNHHTYEIVKQCEEAGLVVIDDSESIKKCTNKIYQNELFKINNIPTLKSKIVCIQNLIDIAVEIKYPCVLKVPDSCCSLGVFKIEDKHEFLQKSIDLLKNYKFLQVQEFYKTDFDWRIAILNNKILFTCKYCMSKNGWQIIDHSDPTEDRLSKCGQTQIIDIEDVPDYIIETALKASFLIGNGLYGVDLKEKDGNCVVIEINDCIDIDIPYEIKENDDSVLIEIFKTLMWKLEIKKSTC